MAEASKTKKEAQAVETKNVFVWNDPKNTSKGGTVKQVPVTK